MPKSLTKMLTAECGRVVAGEDVRHAVLEHPGVAGAVGDDVVKHCGSAPALMPSAMASAAAAMCTPASSWLTIFTFEPVPGASPRR